MFIQQGYHVGGRRQGFHFNGLGALKTSASNGALALNGWLTLLTGVTNNVHHLVTLTVSTDTACLLQWHDGITIYGHLHMGANNPVHLNFWPTPLTLPSGRSFYLDNTNAASVNISATATWFKSLYDQ